MAGRNSFGEPNFGKGDGESHVSSPSSRREWISPGEFRRRFESQINASGTSSHRVPRVAGHNPTYPVPSANQVQVKICYYFLDESTVVLC